MERIHSSTIAWIVSDSCKALSIAARTKILNTLFGTEKNNITSIVSYTEYKHMDVAFKTLDSNGLKLWWFLENKIKAPLRVNQLEDYSKIIRNETNINHNYNCAILTLRDIFPQDQTAYWHVANYHQLAEILKVVCKESIEGNVNQLGIIKEYIQCITNLEYAFSEFMNNPKKYPRVFTGGDMPKAEKCLQTYDTEIMQYISKNSLETLFQKLYFTNILFQIKHENNIINGCHVGETRGNAEFGFELGACVADPNYLFDLSFQKGSFKFSVYKKGYPRIKGQTKDEILIWIEVFNRLSNDPSFPNYTKINKPKKGKARISISYNIGVEWYEMDKKEFLDIVLLQIHDAKKMVISATMNRKSMKPGQQRK